MARITDGWRLGSSMLGSCSHLPFFRPLSVCNRPRSSAVNEFREALNGDLRPSCWIKVWSHVNMGKIFDTRRQRERALDEYRIAEETKDNTRAQDEVAEYRQSPYKER